MKKLLLFLLPCLLLTSLKGQEIIDTIEDSIITDMDIFSIDAPAEFTLRFDMKEFHKQQKEDKYIDAELVYHLGDSMNDRSNTVRIKARGKSRQDICSFPPIWINIRKANIENRPLKDVKRIKLVTHCVNGKAYENFVVKEYLAYRIYNLLSPYSFRVRMVKMNYIDTSRKDKRIETLGFLIEPESMLAERLDLQVVKNPHISMKMTEGLWTARMGLFQFMIGNSDYAIKSRHNVKLLADKDFPNGSIYPVPYDFDYSGFVNPPYAVPGENLGIKYVTDRYYLGPCRSEEEILEIRDWIAEHKDEIYELINNYELTPEKVRETMIGYLDEFFLFTENPRYIRTNIIATCR